MKTKDTRDPLDRKIDELLGEHTVRPSDDFIARTLDAAENITQEQPQRSRFNIIPFALPIAAIIVFALFISAQIQRDTTRLPLENQISTNTPQPSPAPLVEEITYNPEFQEILLLQEGLSGLAAITDDTWPEDDLLENLDALYFDLES